MKTISTALQAHLAGELTTLAVLVKLTCATGAVKAFTTHDAPVIYNNVTYIADGALTASAIDSRAGLAVDNLEVTGVLDSDAIDPADIEKGIYDFARVDVYTVNWADVTQGALQMRRGWLGQVTRAGGHYVAELRGLHDLLQRTIGDCATAECRFDLGDASCGVTLTTLTGTVTTALDDAAFVDAAQTAATGTLAYGLLTWTSGANAGQKVEVKTWNADTHQFTLWLPVPAAPVVGDAYKVTLGCDKRFTTCKNKFSNAANFGGFPYVPGVGNILKYPS